MLAIILSTFSTLLPVDIGRDSIEIPFVRSGNLILLEGSVNGHDGYFILDTGASNIVINNAYAGGSWGDKNSSSWNAAGHKLQARYTTARRFRIGTIEKKVIYPQVQNLMNIERLKGRKILGLLGIEFFRNYRVVINTRKQILSLYDPAKPYDVEPAPGEYMKIPFSLAANLILVNTNIRQRRYKLLFDTGAETSYLSNDIAHSMPDQFEMAGYARMAIPGGNVSPARDGILRLITIGDLVFVKLRVLLTNVNKSMIGPYDTVHGAIGYDLLRTGVVEIDFRTLEITVYPFASQDDTIATTN